MSKRTGGFDYRTLVPATHLESNHQVVSTQLTPDITLIVPGMGVLDKETLAATLGWKAEYKKGGAGNIAYEEARRQLEEEDQQKRIQQIMNPKPVRPVGAFFEEHGDQFFIFSNAKAGKPEKRGTTIYRLEDKKPIF